ncbi:MAG: hypothetical protein N2446_01720 [Elusimicrobiales bacterium]|nr:hypothetical protein [Elusimicrobiales bacterium]
MNKNKTKIVLFEKNNFYLYYIEKILKKLKYKILFKKKFPNNIKGDIFIISSYFIDNMVKNNSYSDYFLVLNRKNNKFIIISKFEKPKIIYKKLLSICRS